MDRENGRAARRSGLRRRRGDLTSRQPLVLPGDEFVETASLSAGCFVLVDKGQLRFFEDREEFVPLCLAQAFFRLAEVDAENLDATAGSIYLGRPSLALLGPGLLW